jgi:hypothetical protein
MKLGEFILFSLLFFCFTIGGFLLVIVLLLLVDPIS